MHQVSLKLMESLANIFTKFYSNQQLMKKTTHSTVDPVTTIEKMMMMTVVQEMVRLTRIVNLATLKLTCAQFQATNHRSRRRRNTSTSQADQLNQFTHQTQTNQIAATRYTRRRCHRPRPILPRRSKNGERSDSSSPTSCQSLWRGLAAHSVPLCLTCCD